MCLIAKIYLFLSVFFYQSITKRIHRSEMKSIRYNVLFLVAARRQIHDVRVNREMLREIY